MSTGEDLLAMELERLMAELEANHARHRKIVSRLARLLTDEDRQREKARLEELEAKVQRISDRIDALCLAHEREKAQGPERAQ